MSIVKKKKPKKKRPTRTNLFNKYLGRFGIFFSLLIVFIVSLFTFQDYLFFKNLYLFKDIGSDSLNIVYPKFIHLSDYLRKEGIPGWSFNQGMGQYIYPFSLSDPFYWIEYILGREYLAYGLAYVEVIKITLSSICIYFYLRHLKLYKYVLVIGTLVFSFSSFMILGGGWWVFSTQAFHLSVLLLAFEKLFKQNSWWLFPIAILLIASYQPFNLYVFSIFLLFYSIIRYINSSHEKLNGYLFLMFKMTLLAIIGIGISSVFLFSNIYELLQSPRVGGDSTYFQRLYSTSTFSLFSPVEAITAITRFFSSDLLGTGSNFKGYLNYLEAPMFYIGLISLVLAPHAFHGLTKKQTIYYSIIPILLIIPIVFPFFRYSFWLFTGNYYRTFSFFVSFIVMLYALKGLKHILKTKSVNIVTSLITLGVLLLGLYYPYQLSGNIDNDLRTIIVVFLVLYTILLHGLSIFKLRFISQILILVLVCVELSYFSYITTSNRSTLSVEEYNQKKGYNDYTNEAIEYLKSIDNSFYRVSKDYSSGPAMHSSINDAKVQDYYGTSSYHSFNQKYYIEFLQATNIIKKGLEHQTRWARGLGGRPLLQSFGSVKYGLTKGDGANYKSRGYSFLKKTGNVSIYQNNFVLPLGFTYDNYTTVEDFDKLPNLQKDISLLHSFVIPNESPLQNIDFAKLDLNQLPSNFTNNEYTESINKRRQDQFNISTHQQNLIEGSITVDKKKLLFFSIPYDKGWQATVNGKTTPLHKTNIGFMGLILDQGVSEIRLTYTMPYFYWGAFISVIFMILYTLIIIKKRRYTHVS